MTDHHKANTAYLATTAIVIAASLLILWWAT